MDTPRPSSQIQALALVWDVILSVALPPVILAFIGRNLDQRFGTKRLCTLIGLGLAFTVSSILVYRQARHMQRTLKSSSSSDHSSPT